MAVDDAVPGAVYERIIYLSILIAINNTNVSRSYVNREFPVDKEL